MWHFLIPQSAKLAFKVKKKFRFFIFIWFEKFCDQTLDCILIMILHQINQGLHFVLTLPFLNKTVILLLNNKKKGSRYCIFGYEKEINRYSLMACCLDLFILFVFLQEWTGRSVSIKTQQARKQDLCSEDTGCNVL